MDQDAIYRGLKGGAELISWFGHCPTFHDAEIVSLDLRRREPSRLSVHGWNIMSTLDHDGYYVLDRHAVVTFVLEEILDLELRGFSAQNVISELTIARAPIRPERQKDYTLDASPDDYELLLEDCYGLAGRFSCRRISIELTPGMPSDATLPVSPQRG